MYKKGLGVSENKAEGIRLYQLSAEKGNSTAQSNFGWAYIWGNGQGGLEVDFEKGAMWLQKSAEQGSQYGQRNFGRAYEEGKGVTKNLAKAAEWYEKSAAQGNKSAKERLKKLLQ